MNKKFIEHMERTVWNWNEESQCFRYLWNGTHAKPADLLGWQIAFAEKCGYIITVSWNNVDRYKWEIQIPTDESFYKHNMDGYKTYQKAFDAAFNKVIELIEA